MKFENEGVIEYPEYINTVSLYVGKLRDLLNSEMNEVHTQYKRGDKSELVNILGIRCELIAQNFLFNKDIKFTAAKLIDNKPVVGADIFIGDKICIDVKGLFPDAMHLLVNERAHEKVKNVTHYWFIQPLTSTTAKYWIFKHDEVSKWNVENFNYSDAYSMPLTHLIKHDFSIHKKQIEEAVQ